MSILINEFLDKVRNEFAQKEFDWSPEPINDEDIAFLREECNKDSEFDPLNKRKSMFDNIKDPSKLIVSTCTYGKLIALLDNIEQIAEIPWDLWGRILRMFSEEGRKPFRIFFLANTNLREFPTGNDLIKPQNINGGYTYHCNTETIMIYRAEDATRVLIHEIMHACCLDKVEKGVDIVEAETEAWAELAYIAILSQGKKYIFNPLLQRQSEWMRKQNNEVIQHMKNPDSKEFPWRYTLGKEDVWQRWGILKMENVVPYIRIGKSLRLTFPPTDVLKDRFKVLHSSTIL